MVWRTQKEELDPECTVSTVKHGGGSVMCWECFSSAGVCNLVFIYGNRNGEIYRDILEKNLKMGNDWVFQHDNDPKHRAAIMTN